MTVTAGQDVAIAHAIMRCDTGSTPGGFCFRLTIGLRSIGGEWYVTHEPRGQPMFFLSLRRRGRRFPFPQA